MAIMLVCICACSKKTVINVEIDELDMKVDAESRDLFENMGVSAVLYTDFYQSCSFVFDNLDSEKWQNG